jgi:dihydroflavonol-4-reductase
VIAVSGASGFLGSYVVCMLLEKGSQVRAFRRATSDMREFEQIFSYYFQSSTPQQQQQYKANLQWVTADVLDLPSLEAALEGVDDVYHCAALVSFIQKDRDQMMRINIEGTANMVNTSLLKRVKKFCHVSSIAALGRAKSGDEITEETQWVDSKNNSNYAISKYLAEMEVWRGAEEGLNIVIVNPGVIFGTGDWNKGSCKLFKLVWKGMPFFTNGVNGYVDVKDVASAMIQLTEQSVFNQRFVLVGKNVNMKWYLDTVATHFGKKKPTIEVKKFLSQLAWMADGFKSFLLGKTPSLTKETATASINQFYYNNNKIQQQIGFQFRPIEQTIAEACKQFLLNHQ